MHYYSSWSFSFCFLDSGLKFHDFFALIPKEKNPPVIGFSWPYCIPNQYTYQYISGFQPFETFLDSNIIVETWSSFEFPVCLINLFVLICRESGCHYLAENQADLGSHKADHQHALECNSLSIPDLSVYPMHNRTVPTYSAKLVSLFCQHPRLISVN